MPLVGHRALRQTSAPTRGGAIWSARMRYAARELGSFGHAEPLVPAAGFANPTAVMPVRGFQQDLVLAELAPLQLNVNPVLFEHLGDLSFGGICLEGLISELDLVFQAHQIE
jgi:hypothetical protein